MYKNAEGFDSLTAYLSLTTTSTEAVNKIGIFTSVFQPKTNRPVGM